MSRIRACSVVFAVLIAASSAAAPLPELVVPQTGTPSERVTALWEATRARLSSDVNGSLTDLQWVELGKPLVHAWESLAQSLGDDPAATPIRSVTRLLSDLYGRPYSTPERRTAIRNQARAAYGERILQIESRLH